MSTEEADALEKIAVRMELRVEETKARMLLLNEQIRVLYNEGHTIDYVRDFVKSWITEWVNSFHNELKEKKLLEFSSEQYTDEHALAILQRVVKARDTYQELLAGTEAMMMGYMAQRGIMLAVSGFVNVSVYGMLLPSVKDTCTCVICNSRRTRDARIQTDMDNAENEHDSNCQCSVCRAMAMLNLMRVMHTLGGGGEEDDASSHASSTSIHSASNQEVEQKQQE